MTRAWAAFVALLDRKESGTAMAIVRVVLGACVLRTVLAVWWAGAVPLVWYDIADGGHRALPGSYLIRWLGGPSAALTDALLWGSVIGGSLVAAGVGGVVGSRVITFATLQVFQGLVDSNGQAGGSYDLLINNMLWLQVLMGPTGTLSLECRLRTGRWTSDTPVAFWPRLLVVYQAVLMYTTTGLQKLSIHWIPGGDLAALYYILQQPTWQHFDHTWIAPYYRLTQLGTLVTWLWEVGGPLWLASFLRSLGYLQRWTWLWPVRPLFIAVGLFFHLCVAMLMDIGPFTWASLSVYAAFVHPWEWERALGVGAGVAPVTRGSAPHPAPPP